MIKTDVFASIRKSDLRTLTIQPIAVRLSENCMKNGTCHEPRLDKVHRKDEAQRQNSAKNLPSLSIKLTPLSAQSQVAYTRADL